MYVVRSSSNSLLYPDRSLIRKRHNKIPYELLHDRKPNLKYIHVFGALCYPTNGSEDLASISDDTTGTPSSTTIDQDAPYQSKYALEILKKYDMESSNPVDTPMVERTKLDKDLQGTPVDPTRYRSMVGSLLYLTSSRPDLVFAVCICVRYQAKPTEKHLHGVKWVFQYLKGTINIGL
ncbi:uncharacterized mitochondrial protein-like protein [Tanacetum coccineum]